MVVVSRYADTSTVHGLGTCQMTLQLPTKLATTAATGKRNELHNSDYKPSYSHDKPFIAWDGEGYTDDTGKHHLMLYGCSTGDHVKSTSLTSIECFELMLSVAAKTKAIHVIFAGGYDMVMMIHKYPAHIAERILKGHATWYRGYRIEYFKSKYLKLSDGRRSIILYDVFTFFATSFVRACREYLGDNPDFDRIEATKLVRDKFTLATLESDVIPYWLQELHYLVQLCTTLRERLLSADINCTQWHGPGAVASAILKSKGVTAHMAKTPEHIREAARHAYYGGRFEQYQIGLRTEQTWQYDIRSAYPAAITRLPSLASITWCNHVPRTRQGRYLFDVYGLYEISYTAGEADTSQQCQPLPWRDKDRSIYYPPDIYKSWYWGVELLSLQQAKPEGRIVVHQGYHPATNPIDFPFQWVNQLYQDRAAAKRRGDPVQLAQKLGLNSIYGKLAQSKGAKKRDDVWQLPRFHQLEWAGWITAATRAKIFEAMILAGNSLIAVETDAIYTTKPIPELHCTQQLGDWEMDISEAIMYIQSGVYFKKVDGSWKLKSRGFEPRNHTFENWKNVMATLPSETPVTHKSIVRRFGTDARSPLFATWYEQEREASILAEQGKRVHRVDQCLECERGFTLTGSLHPLVIPINRINSANHSSTPHRLPWVEDGLRGWDEDFTVTEDGMYSLEFGDEQL